MVLKLLNKITKKELELSDIEDTQISNSFFNFKITLPEDAVDGVYEYELSQEDEVIARGLAIIGDFNPERKTFNNSTKTYKTYGE